MARGAAHTFLHMNAVIEEHEVRKLIHPFPLNRLIRSKTLANRREYGRVFPHLRVTGHARFGWRHAGKRRVLDRSMAVAAIQPEPCHVVLMAEGRWLRERHVDPGRIR